MVVHYLSDKYADSVSTLASKKMFELAGVKVEKYQGRYSEVILK